MKSKQVLILGVNGFIGHHLTKRILDETNWRIFGIDIHDDRVGPFLKNNRFVFKKADQQTSHDLIDSLVKKSDVVLPLVAVATPASYIKEPVRVFELDFESNLPIIRSCVKHKKRVVFPSTSEVYGLSDTFDPDSSNLVVGPINKVRWIYSCSKQMMDRVIWAYGMEQDLDFTLIRPFNWIGLGLDSIDAPKEGSSRVISQFLGNIVRGEEIKLVNGGSQRRSFTYIDDGIDALIKIIENKRGVTKGKIYNIGNPKNNYSIKELAETMIKTALRFQEFADNARKVKLVEIPEDKFYGKGYQDIKNRTPKIDTTMQDLSWEPKVSFEDALYKIFEAYRENTLEAKRLIYES